MSKQRKGYRAVFFDCTGTLYDPQSDQRAHLEAAREIVRHFKLDVTPQSLLERFSEKAQTYLTKSESDEFLDGDGMLRAVLPHFGTILQIPKTHEHFEFVKAVVRKTHSQYGALMPGAAETLAGVKERGLHVGLISHIDRDLLGALLDSLKIRDYFDSITTAEEAGVRRPDPRIFELACGKAETSAKQAFFVGDEPDRDIRTAQALGFTTVYYRPVSGDEPVETANFEISNLPELLEILDRDGRK